MIQKVLFKPTTEWVHPNHFPDLSKYDEIAIDLETKDPELKKMGPGMFREVGEIVGFAVAVKIGLVIFQYLMRVVVTWIKQKSYPG